MTKSLTLLFACLVLCSSFAAARGASNIRINRAAVERETRQAQQKTRTRILEEIDKLSFPERFQEGIKYLKSKDVYLSHAMTGTLTEAETQAAQLYGRGQFSQAFSTLGFDMKTVVLSLDALHRHIPELNLNFFRWLSEPTFSCDETYLTLLWQADQRQKQIDSLATTWEPSAERDYFLRYLQALDGLINRCNIRALTDEDRQILNAYHDGDLQTAYRLLGFDFQHVIDAEEAVGLHHLRVERHGKNALVELNLFAWPADIEWNTKKTRAK